MHAFRAVLAAAVLTLQPSAGVPSAELVERIETYICVTVGEDPFNTEAKDKLRNRLR